MSSHHVTTLYWTGQSEATPPSLHERVAVYGSSAFFRCKVTPVEVWTTQAWVCTDTNRCAIGVLDHVLSDKPQAQRKTLSHYLTKIARLGGYLARANDPPPGNTVMWRGLSHLTDIALGAVVGAEIVGN